MLPRISENGVYLAHDRFLLSFLCVEIAMSRFRPSPCHPRVSTDQAILSFIKKALADPGKLEQITGESIFGIEGGKRENGTCCRDYSVTDKARSLEDRAYREWGASAPS
jgi:hypothetical protein